METYEPLVESDEMVEELVFVSEEISMDQMEELMGQSNWLLTKSMIETQDIELFLDKHEEASIEQVVIEATTDQWSDAVNALTAISALVGCAIAHRPKLIIMDEPTVGIDPHSRNYILNSVRKLNEMGCTIIYTSHYMEEVEEICSRIGIIDHGKIIAEGTKEQLKSIITDSKEIWIGIKVDEMYSLVHLV